jgi:hypothetical protein
MIPSDIKTTWRNLLKHKGYSIISIFSLTVGVSCFILLTLYLRHEKSIDTCFSAGNRTFLLSQKMSQIGGTHQFGETSAIIGPALKAEFPEVESAIRVYQIYDPLFFEDHSALGFGLYADRDFLADEPTGNLNSEQDRQIMELLKKLNKEGTTIVQVTHNEEQARYSERIIRLKDGWLE